jgi:hypothetical protein
VSVTLGFSRGLPMTLGFGEGGTLALAVTLGYFGTQWGLPVTLGDFGAYLKP